MSCINKPDSLRDLTTFMISFISSFKIINVAFFVKSEGCVADPKIFLWIAASVADAVTVNPNAIKTLLANALSTFFL